MTTAARRLLASFCAATLVLSASLAAGQSNEDPEAPNWERSVEGLGQALGSREGLGVLVATPTEGPDSEAVAQLIRQFLIDSGMAEVVMDDSALGSLEGLSDDEIIERARKYPVDVVLVVRTFPGASGPTVVLRVESTREPTRTYRLRPGKQTRWEERPAAELSTPKPEPAPERAPTIDERQPVEAADSVRSTAVALTETIRLIDAEMSRKALEFEPRGNFGRIVDVDGESVPWPDAYVAIGGEDLERAWRARRAVRTSAFVSGGILSAAGVGLLFVSLTNSANCPPEDRETCASPAMTGLGALSLSVGAIAVFTGLLVSPHPVTIDELDELVDRYNGQLSNR